MKLERQEEAALKKFKEILFRQFGREIVSIHLFGSKARGDAHQESDIDILVVTRRDDWRLKEKIGRVATQILLDDGVYLSVKVFGEAFRRKLIRVGSIFMRNVQKEGVVL